jgi:hypothetical protein
MLEVLAALAGWRAIVRVCAVKLSGAVFAEQVEKIGTCCKTISHALREYMQ